MADHEQDVTQKKDYLQLFEDVKRQLGELISLRSILFGEVPGPHTTLHNIGQSQGGFSIGVMAQKYFLNLGK